MPRVGRYGSVAGRSPRHRLGTQGWQGLKLEAGAAVHRAESASEVDRVAEVARQAGARNIEVPMQYERGYYAVFFEDPCGNRLEVCYRTHGTES